MLRISVEKASSAIRQDLFRSRPSGGLIFIIVEFTNDRRASSAVFRVRDKSLALTCTHDMPDGSYLIDSSFIQADKGFIRELNR